MAVDVSDARTGARPAFFDRSARRLSTETKHSTKSTELYAYIATVIGILIAAAVIGGDDDAGRGGNFGDYFTAYDAWRLIAFLTIGYMVARGLAKSGSREPYWQGGSNEETSVERER